MHPVARPLRTSIGAICLVLHLILAGGAAALPADLPLWRPGDPDPTYPFSDRKPAVIVAGSTESAAAIAATGMDVESIRPSEAGPLVIANLSPGDEADLRASGYEIHILRNLALEMNRAIPPGSRDDRAWPTWDQLQTELQATAAAHPNICRLVSVGQSVQGRSIWFMRITDNPDSDENEPEFRFTSSLHGDEVTGMELCRRLIQLLTDNYGTDPTLTAYVDDIDIWICPMSNPDGFVAVTRYNAHGVDLNRDFPDPVTDPNDDPAGREPETQALMYLGYDHRFILSANYHGGALVVNYPWDCKAEYTPDDTMIRNFSLGYSYRNPPMWNNPSFPNGVTIGWEWYIVHGGLQDWCYEWRSDIDVTIEVSNTKWPNYNLMDQFWLENRDAMLWYMSRARIGVRGIVKDAATFAPLDATVDVLEIGKPIRTDPDLGDYHRMLEPGTYTLQVSAIGYLPQTIAGVVVTDGPATIRDIDLQPLPSYELSGTVSDEESGAPLSALVQAFRYDSQELAAETLTDPVTGAYSLTLRTYTYDVRVSADAHVPETRRITLDQDRVENFALDATADRILVVQDGSQTRIASDLQALGYAVSIESAGSTVPSSWSDYKLLVWSAGANADPVSSAVVRAALESHVTAGNPLLIEGGQVGYDVFRTPGYPSFGQLVLHGSAWDANNAGDLPLTAPAHALATTPNALPALLDLNYVSTGDEDAVRPLPDASLVFGTQSYAADAGILAFDDLPGDPSRGLIVYFAFNYDRLTDVGVARDLLENSARYLDRVDPASAEESSRIKSADLRIVPNPARGVIRLSLEGVPGSERQVQILDAAGRIVWTTTVALSASGTDQLTWAGTTRSGTQLAPGVYFVRLPGPAAVKGHQIIWLGR